MIKQFLQNIIADPLGKQPLHYDANTQQLVNTETNTCYATKDDVAILLPVQEEMESQESAIHEQFNSTFKYAEHYEKDTQLFNYFVEDESLVTRAERNRERQAIISCVPKQAKIIVDVGCGGGWVAQHFLPKGKQVISMDISISNPTKVLAALPHQNHAAIVADAFHFPFKPNSIDCIIASEVIEHVYDPAIFIKNLVEALTPKGKIIMITPYNQKIQYHLCIHCNKPTPESAHLHFFNEKNIIEYLPTQGIKYHTQAIINKYFLKLRLYNLFSFLPFPIWKIMDKIANALFRKPDIFLIEIIKS